MHVGWLIEGPVGSNFKIDALYLSPSITIWTKLQYLSEDVYDCSIMMTEDFKHCLSPTSLMLKFTRPPLEDEGESEPIRITAQSLRLIDRVFMKWKGIPMDLYSFDIWIPEVDIIPPENHLLGDLIVNPHIEENEDMEKVKKYPLSYMFAVDEDVYNLQKHRFGNDFYVEYNEAFEAYIDGEWEYAVESIEKWLAIDPNDGPWKELRRYMRDENNSKTPAKWMGYREVSTFNLYKNLNAHKYYSSCLKNSLHNLLENLKVVLNSRMKRKMKRHQKAILNDCIDSFEYSFILYIIHIQYLNKHK